MKKIVSVFLMFAVIITMAGATQASAATLPNYSGFNSKVEKEYYEGNKHIFTYQLTANFSVINGKVVASNAFAQKKFVDGRYDCEVTTYLQGSCATISIAYKLKTESKYGKAKVYSCIGGADGSTRWAVMM